MRHIIATSSRDAQDWILREKPYGTYIPSEGWVHQHNGIILRDYQKLSFGPTGELVTDSFGIIQTNINDYSVFPVHPADKTPPTNSLLLFSGADSERSWVRGAPPIHGKRHGTIVSSAVWGDVSANRCATICILRPGEVVGYEVTSDSFGGVYVHLYEWDGTELTFRPLIRKEDL